MLKQKYSSTRIYCLDILFWKRKIASCQLWTRELGISTHQTRRWLWYPVGHTIQQYKLPLKLKSIFEYTAPFQRTLGALQRMVYVTAAFWRIRIIQDSQGRKLQLRVKWNSIQYFVLQTIVWLLADSQNIFVYLDGLSHFL